MPDPRSLYTHSLSQVEQSGNMPDERLAPTVRLRMSKLFLLPEALKAFAGQILQFCGRPADSSYFGRENWTRNNHCVL